MRALIISTLIVSILCLSSIARGQDQLQVDDGMAIPGSQFNAIIRLDNELSVQGFQCALTWDSNIFTFTGVTLSGLDIEELLGPFEVEFFTSTNQDEIEAGAGWAACAAIFDFSPPFGGQTLEPGIDNSIVCFQYQVAADNALVGSCADITPVNGMGQPVIQNILTIDGISSLPELSPGTVCFIDSEPFLRGDANDDGGLNLADAIYLIAYIFVDGEAPLCRSAANSNSDANVDIGDVIFIINHQFLAGPPPSAPYPTCGANSAGESGLSCESYQSCP